MSINLNSHKNRFSNIFLIKKYLSSIILNILGIWAINEAVIGQKGNGILQFKLSYVAYLSKSGQYFVSCTSCELIFSGEM